MQISATDPLPPGSAVIEQRVVQAVLSGEIAPGERLGEKELGDIFGVSRTLVREAMMRLSSRGIVTVSPRRGWFVNEPTIDDALETIEARRAVEVGLLHMQTCIQSEAIQRLEAHVQEQRQAIEQSDPARRSYLLGHFHVCLAETLGNPLLAAIMEELAMKTVLIAALYQSTDHAMQSCDNHRRLTEALAQGDIEQAVAIMNAHLSHLVKILNMCGVHKRKKRLQNALRTPNAALGPG